MLFQPLFEFDSGVIDPSRLGLAIAANRTDALAILIKRFLLGNPPALAVAEVAGSGGNAVPQSELSHRSGGSLTADQSWR